MVWYIVGIKMIQTIKLKSGEESITVHDSAMFGLVVPLAEVTHLLEQAYLRGINAGADYEDAKRGVPTAFGPEHHTNCEDSERLIPGMATVPFERDAERLIPGMATVPFE